MKRMKLKLARVEKDMTQKEIAEHLGVSTARYCKMELGQQNPTLEQAQALSKLLKINIANI